VSAPGPSRSAKPKKKAKKQRPKYAYLVVCETKISNEWRQEPTDTEDRVYLFRRRADEFLKKQPKNTEIVRHRIIKLRRG
jgi:hypothetical protein